MRIENALSMGYEEMNGGSFFKSVVVHSLLLGFKSARQNQRHRFSISNRLMCLIYVLILTNAGHKSLTRLTEAGTEVSDFCPYTEMTSKFWTSVNLVSDY